jgi:tight adherence protein C
LSTAAGGMLLFNAKNNEYQGVNMLTYVMLGLEIFGLFVYWLFSRNRYAEFIRENPYLFKLSYLQTASLLVLDQTKLMERIPDFTLRIHHKLLLLYGRSITLNSSKQFYAEMLSGSYVCLFIFTLIGVLAGGDITFVGLGVFGALVIPFLLLKDMEGQIRKKQQLMILELPDVLSTIILLVNAGETVQRAWIRCMDAKRDAELSPLFKELDIAVRELQMNLSFTKVMEDFSKRCALQEVSLFTSTLLLNYKRGGNDFVLALQGLSQELWQRRKSVSRTLGEEASSKLVFPMVLIFVVVMVIVGAPALLIMNQ